MSLSKAQKALPFTLDILVHGLDAEPLAVNVGVVHTLQSAINLAHVQPGQLARKLEQRKVLERQAFCRRNGWTFSPFAMETIGVWGGKARHVVQKLAAWTNLSGYTKHEAASLCRSRLELALVRGLARQLKRGFPLPLPQPTAEEFVDLYSF